MVFTNKFFEYFTKDLSISQLFNTIKETQQFSLFETVDSEEADDIYSNDIESVLARGEVKKYISALRDTKINTSTGTGMRTILEVSFSVTIIVVRKWT